MRVNEYGSRVANLECMFGALRCRVYGGVEDSECMAPDLQPRECRGRSAGEGLRVEAVEVRVDGGVGVVEVVRHHDKRACACGRGR